MPATHPAPHTVSTKDIYGNTYQVPTSELTWRPAAYAVIVRDNKLLVIHEDNGYHLPGGGIEFGELPEQTVTREVKEESGLLVANPRLINAGSNFFTWKELGTETLHHHQSIMLYFVCDYGSGELSTAGHDEYEQAQGVKPMWLPLGKLDSIKIGSTIDWRPLIKIGLSK